MLTAFQCTTGAYQTRDGELLCEDCTRSADDWVKPVSNYGLDEWQVSMSEDYCAGECLDTLRCYGCGEELREAYEDEDCEEHGPAPDAHELAVLTVEGGGR
jgi:hypothetical protein